VVRLALAVFDADGSPFFDSKRVRFRFGISALSWGSRDTEHITYHCCRLDRLTRPAYFRNQALAATAIGWG